jgi:CRISPR-associated protein Cmr3
MLIQPPADLSIVEDESGKTTVRRLAPLPPATGILSSAHFPLLPVLAENNRAKPAGGYWLTEAGWCSYLRAEVLQAADLVKSGDLWALDHRVGVGLDAARRSAADGRLFSMEAVALKPGVGFLVAVTGAVPPVSGAVRLGGDGRGAVIQKAPIQPPEPDYVALIKAGRCRLILASPGLFAEGWRLPGMVPDGRFEFNGVRAQVVCAAVPRAEVISGWDLAKWQPKPALRAAPGGSVYWLDKLEATPEALRKLAEMGLWGEPCEDSARRAEGYNRFHLAAY